MTKKKKQLVKIARITSAHGLKGEVKISFQSENFDPQNYPIFYIDDDQQEISFRGMVKKSAIAKIVGIDDRDGADKLKNKDISIDRADFPELKKDDEFYIEDLLNISVVNKDGKKIGEIIDVQNYGAGDVISIKFNNGKSEDFPFLDEIFSDVDLDKQIISFTNPEIMD